MLKLKENILYNVIQGDMKEMYQYCYLYLSENLTQIWKTNLHLNIGNNIAWRI